MSLHSPQRFGRYLLLEQIATGGMAEVFKAKSYGVEGFEKLLVIKRILPHLSCNPRFVSMFISEAKISVSLNHSNIGQVYHLGREGDDYFISMEFIHGRDLMRVLRECKRQNTMVPIPLAVFIAAEVARGLDYAHRTADSAGNPLRIIHRDISSHNVICSFEGEVKIVDFGIAQLSTQLDAGEQKTQMAGKATYMPPEQARGGVVDTRSDLFSLGSVLYELLTRQRLYQGQSLPQKMEQARAATYIPPRTHRPEIPPELEAILTKLLQRDPADRYQSASALYDDLSEFLFHQEERVSVQSLKAFVRDLFAEELRQEATSRMLREAVGDLDRLGRYGDDLTRTFAARGTFSHTHSGSDSMGSASRGDSSGSQPQTSSKPDVLRDRTGARRSVVAMIVEPFGFTDLSNSMSSERYLRLALKWFKAMAGPIEKHGGRIDRFVNDRIWALWGLAHASEHDVSRSLTCAEDLKAAQARFNKRHSLDIGIAIAVHQGLALVGGASRWGEEASADEATRAAAGYTALGDTLRLPERILMQASPGDVFVSEAARSHSHVEFVFEEAGPLTVPWGSGSASIHRCTGEKSPGERQLRHSAERRGGWLDRGNEWEILRYRVRRLKEGQGGLLHLVGDAGIGKSRFLRKVSRYVASSGLGLISGSCLFRDRERPMAIFRDMLTAGCRIERADSLATRREKVGSLAELGIPQADVQLIASLLGVGEAEAEDAQAKQEGIFRAIRRVLEGLCRVRPLLLVIENIQWMDPKALVFIEQTLPMVEDWPMLLLFTHRPDFGIPWEAHPQLGRIDLGPLGPEETETLVASLLKVNEVPSSLVEALHLRSDGNPLHVEQLVKVLQEQGHIVVRDGNLTHSQVVAEAAVPVTLQGLIESRVDALSDDERQLLQSAAVYGRRADLIPLRHQAGLASGDMTAFQNLIDRGLVTLDADEQELSFHTHLTWEVTYQGIPPVTRRELHLKAAVALRDTYQGAEPEHAEELYRHYLEGGRGHLAARYAELAADRYHAEHFVSKAIDFYSRSIELMAAEEARDSSGAVLRDLGRLYAKVGPLQAMVADPGAAEASLLRGMDVAADLEDERLEASLLTTLGQIKADHGEAFVARNYLEMALENAEMVGDPALLAEVLERLGSFNLSQGDKPAATEALERGLEVARKHGDPLLIGNLLIRLGDIHARDSAFMAAIQCYEDCMKRAQEASDRLLMGRALNNMGSTLVSMGRYERAMECYRRSIDVREGIGYVRGLVVNYHNIGDLYFRQESFGKAYAYFQQSLELAREYRWSVAEALNLIYMGYIEAQQGQPGGMERLREGMGLAERAQHEETVAVARYMEGLHQATIAADEGRRLLAEARDMARSVHYRVLEQQVNEALSNLDDDEGVGGDEAKGDKDAQGEDE